MIQEIAYVFIGIIVAGVVFELFPVIDEIDEMTDMFTMCKAAAYAILWPIVIPVYLVRLAIRKSMNNDKT